MLLVVVREAYVQDVLGHGERRRADPETDP
jgi:hypothetical protein